MLCLVGQQAQRHEAREDELGARSVESACARAVPGWRT